jgi:hypothetical protein
MLRRFLAEVARLDLPAAPALRPNVTEADLEPLPPAVQRYLRFMRVPARPRTWSFLLGQTGTFRLGRDKPWIPCECWQYDSSPDISRVFHIRMRLGPLPVLARDTYLDGHGRMLARALGLFTVADGIGEAYDVSELVTWLNDAILYAPSMLLRPRVAWHGVDDATFAVTLADRGHTVHARVVLDERGAPREFHTSDRFVEDPFDPQHPLIRGHWMTPTDEWDLSGERPLPRHGKAVWILPGGVHEYADVRVTTIAYDLAPGEAPALAPRPAERHRELELL